jgi:hypothetical protein
MAWLQVGKYRSYRRSVRAGRRVRTHYYGAGVEGELAFALDQERQRQRLTGRQVRARVRGVWETASLPLGKLIDVTDLLLAAALNAAGYHCHQRGEWRKWRGNPEHH